MVCPVDCNAGLATALVTIQVGFSEQPPLCRLTQWVLGSPGGNPGSSWTLCVQPSVWLPQEPNYSSKVQRMGSAQGTPLVPSHPVPVQPTHLSIRIASVLRSFSSHVSFSSAMIFSVSCQGRVKQGVSAWCGQYTAHSAQFCPACFSGTLVPVSGLFVQTASAFHPQFSISPIFKE